MKLIICFFEGISEQLLDNYINEGLLPNFQRFKLEGLLGRLLCNQIPYEASGITTALSGKSVHEHGIISYWNPNSSEYIPEAWESSDIKKYMFWNHPSYCGYNYLLINIFGTQPVYDIHGKILSYSMEKNLRFSYPKDLMIKLQQKKLPYVQDTCSFFQKDTVKSEFCADVLKIDLLRNRVFMELIQDNIDCGIVNFTAIDRLSHFCFDETKDVQLSQSLLFRAYQQCDQFLGQYMEIANKYNSQLLVVSEIGFGHLKKFVRINDYLHEKNFLSKKLPSGGICWDKTIAFEAVQGTLGVNINRKGFYEKGIVSEEDYHKVLMETIQLLEKMSNPYTGLPMFSKVMPGIEYSISPNVPDIITLPEDWEYLPYGDPYWADHVSRDLQTGWHRPISVWGLYNKSGYKGESTISLTNIYDIIIGYLNG